MHAKNSILIILLIFNSLLNAQKEKKLLDEAVLLSRYTLTNTAYCSNGSDRAQNGNPRFYGPMEAKIMSFKNYLYVSYYEVNGSLVVARKKITPESNWEKSVIQGYQIKSHDRHNKIAMEISEGDGVIHLSFDHHNTPQLNYALSKIGVATNPDSVMWDDTVFSLLPNLGLENDIGLVTYPSFYNILSTGDMIIYWRTGGAIGGEMNLANYSSKDHQWRFIGKISSREGTYLDKKGTRGPYHAGFESDKKGVLHVAWLWREDIKLRSGIEGIGNHGIYYAQSPDGGFTWKNSKGTEVANINTNQQISIENIGEEPVQIPMTLNPTNVGFTSAIHPITGNFVSMLTHYKPETNQRANFLYTRNPDGKWSSQETTMNGEGELLFHNDLLFFIYQEGIFYATRENHFDKWKQITFPVKISKGEANWDTNQLDKGIVSMAIQYTPENIGEPTPIEVFDFKFKE
jgi:hypothetical protein